MIFYKFYLLGEPDPQEYEREVNSLNSLQQQPKPSFMDRIYGGAQGKIFVIVTFVVEL